MVDIRSRKGRWLGLRGGLEDKDDMISGRVGMGEVMWCFIGIEKEVRFYFRCYGKLLKSFKKS